MKRLQNRIAESGSTLPVAMAWGLAVWLLAGLVRLNLWPQLAFFAASVYLLVELSNQNALLRIRSRMVTAVFITLSATASFLFPSFSGGFVQLCFIVALLLLFHTYQRPQAIGTVFYAFLSLGVASLAYVHVLWYVPLVWLLMVTSLNALTWRSWLSSLIGLLTPYWLVLLWMVSPFGMSDGWTVDLSPLGSHFAELADFRLPVMSFSFGHFLSIGVTLLLAGAGMVHFWQYSYEDKIRIRQLYSFFSAMMAFTLLFLLLQPVHYAVLMRLAFLFASPLIAHVMTFTSTKLSNILFFATIALLVVIAIYNL